MRELLERMGSDELVEWTAFYEREPWGYEVEERRHAEVLAMMLNCVPRSGGKVVRWTDLYQNPWGEPLLAEKGWTPEQIAHLEKRKREKSKRKGKK